MDNTSQRSPLYAWYVLAVLFLVNAFNAVDRGMVNILVESIKREFGFSDSEVGILSGLGFALFYALLGVPIARLADTRNRRNLLAIGLAVWSALTVLTGRAIGFTTFLLARAGVGVGEASCYPTAYPLISDYFPKHRRPIAMALFQMGLFTGTIAGGIIAARIAAAHGWRTAFAAIGLPGLALAVLVFATVREPPRGMSDARPPAPPRRPRFGEVAALLGGDRGFLWLVIGTTCLTTASATLSSWGPAFMMRLHGVGQAQVGAVSAPIGLGGLIGTIGGGLAGSWLAGRSADDRAPLAVPLWLSLLALPGTALFVFAPTLPLVVLGGALGAFGIGVHTGPALAVAVGRVRPDMRGLASAVIVIGHLLVGYGLGPVVAGVLSDALAPTHGADALRLALAIVPGLILLGWLALVAAFRIIGPTGGTGRRA